MIANVHHTVREILRSAQNEAVRRPQALAAAVYVALALVIMGPLLGGGYVLTLDMVFGPVEPSPEDLFFAFDAPVLGAKHLPDLVIAISRAILPTAFVQKLVLVGILLAAALAGHHLPPVRSLAARYFAGFLYVVNPFVYVRLLAGQWYILLAYAIIPFAVTSFASLLRQPDRRGLIKTAILLSLVAINSHMVAITLFVFAVLYAVTVIREPERRLIHAWVAALGGLFFLLNAYWIIPAATADDSVLQAITELDLEAFAPLSQFVSPTISIAAMYGFWREGYEYPITMAWPVAIFMLAILWLAFYGFLRTYRSALSITLAVLVAAGLLLAPGINGPFGPVFRFLALNVPLFDGFRDSQKFVVLLVVGYTCLGAIGVEAMLGDLKSWRPGQEVWPRVAAAVALVTPMAYTFTMFWGLGGALKAVDYPADWQQARTLLDEQAQGASVLVLPWDTYMEYSWVPNEEKTVRTLAKAFFEQPLIYPKHVIKRAGIYSQSFAPEQAYMTSVFGDAPVRSDFGSRIASLGAGYVFLAKTIDHQQFNYLYGQDDLELLIDGPTMALFRNEVAAPRFYEVAGPDGGGSRAPMTAERASPVRFRLEDTDVRFFGYAPPNSDTAGWEMDGRGSISTDPGHFGIYEAGEGDLYYTPFRSNLVWYAISGLTLAAAVAVLTLPVLPAFARRAPRAARSRVLSES